ncbi:hypothetical protein PSPO01_16250 [Paraphaeosphaeria sporulosa]
MLTLLEYNAKGPLAPRCGIETMDGPHERPKAKASNTLPRRESSRTVPPTNGCPRNPHPG